MIKFDSFNDSFIDDDVNMARKRIKLKNIIAELNGIVELIYTKNNVRNEIIT